MNKHLAILFVASVSVALAACSKPSEETAAEVTEAPVASEDAAKSDPSHRLAANVPQLTYRYKLSYRLDGDAIARTQDGHVALCRDLGPTRCQLVAMERSAKDDSFPTASLKLRVATAIAPALASCE